MAQIMVLLGEEMGLRRLKEVEFRGVKEVDEKGRIVQVHKPVETIDEEDEDDFVDGMMGRR